MIIYNLVHHGKSFGIEVESYADKDLAVSAAKDYLNSVDPGEWEEWTGNPKAYIFYAYYQSGESSIWVVQTHVRYRPEVATCP